MAWAVAAGPGVPGTHLAHIARGERGGRGGRDGAEDELAQRRYEKLVRRIEELMVGSLRSEYEGYGGQVVLSAHSVEKLGGSVDEIRRAARAVGRRLGWKTVTREIDGRVFVVDDRELLAAVRDLALRQGVRSMDGVWTQKSGRQEVPTSARDAPGR